MCQHKWIFWKRLTNCPTTFKTRLAARQHWRSMCFQICWNGCCSVDHFGILLFNGLLLNCTFGQYAFGKLVFGKLPSYSIVQLVNSPLFNWPCSIDHVQSSLIQSTDHRNNSPCAFCHSVAWATAHNRPYLSSTPKLHIKSNLLTLNKFVHFIHNSYNWHPI